jgi:hypothetical protein
MPRNGTKTDKRQLRSAPNFGSNIIGDRDAPLSTQNGVFGEPYIFHVAQRESKSKKLAKGNKRIKAIGNQKAQREEGKDTIQKQ